MATGSRHTLVTKIKLEQEPVALRASFDGRMWYVAVGMAELATVLLAALLVDNLAHADMFHMLEFATWLNGTGISTYLREADYPFAIIETAHIVGLAFSVGVIVWLDLRLLRILFRDVSISEVIEGTERFAIGGFTLMFASGFLLLLAEPLKCYTNWTFGLKMLGVLLAGVNVLFFHKKVVPNLDKLDQDAPWQAQMVGGVSLALWLTIIVLGRWFAYF